MADVARLDFAGPPPWYAAWKALPSGKPADDRHAWAKYKAENDPPGMYEVWYSAFASDTPAVSGTGLVREAAIRAAAWRWYEARVELYNILRKINPPREFWPVILTWSDQDWIEVHGFLVEHADVIMLGGADGLTFPQVLCG